MSDRWSDITEPIEGAIEPGGGTARFPVTFCITHFLRPELLERLLVSIGRRYPTAAIIVADNSRQAPSVGRGVKIIKLPFDVGVSSCRNALARRVETPYWLLLEEDFVFTDDTDIEQMLQILEHDNEVGIVGGQLNFEGKLHSYNSDLNLFRETLSITPSRGPWRSTPDGVSYQLCDQVFNFSLMRREVPLETPWDQELKLAEHFEFFWRLKMGRRWKTAFCPSVQCDHRRVVDEEYAAYRVRGKHYISSALNKCGASELAVDQRIDYFGPGNFAHDSTKPNIIILGAGHSGTTILTKMLHSLGWEANDADLEYAESVSIRDHNIEICGDIHSPPTVAAAESLQALKTPWAIKDPRFVHTLNKWMPLLSDQRRPPVLVWIERGPEEVYKSYLRRGEKVAMKKVVHLRRLAEKQFQAWCFRKVRVRYEDIVSAIGLFDANRDDTNRDDANQLLEIIGRYNSIESMIVEGKKCADRLFSSGVIEAGQRVLDYGAGLGRLAIPLAERCDVTAADVSQEMLDNLPANVRPTHVDDLKGDLFDAAVCCYVLQHLSLDEAREVVAEISWRSPRLVFTYPTHEQFEALGTPPPKDLFPVEEIDPLPWEKRHDTGGIMYESQLCELFTTSRYDVQTLRRCEKKPYATWVIDRA